MNNPSKNMPDQMTIPLAKKILPLDLADLPLNPREYKFIAAYCANGFQGGEAARQAGYACRTKIHYNGIASELLKRPHITEAIKRYIDMVIQPYKERLEFEIMDRYYKRATYTVDTFMDSDGTPKPLHEIPKEWIACIDGVEEKYFGKDGERRTIIYRLPNRDNALTMLYKFVTGLDPSDNSVQMLPADARQRLSHIFSSAMGAAAASPKNVTPKKARVELE